MMVIICSLKIVHVTRQYINQGFTNLCSLRRHLLLLLLLQTLQQNSACNVFLLE